MNSEVPLSELTLRNGALLLEAKVSYSSGEAVLTVYGFNAALLFVPARHGRYTRRRVLHRVHVPSSMPKADKAQTLRAMCDLITVQFGVPYVLRSKIANYVHPVQQENQK